MEMMIAQPPMREFLQSRAMVPYSETWMGQVDAMRKLMGWSDGAPLTDTGQDRLKPAHCETTTRS